MTHLDTPIEATISEYSPTATSDQIKQMVYDLSRLEQHLEYKDSIINSFSKQLREHEERIDFVKEYVKSMYELGERVSEDITRIVEILDITLTKKYDVTINPIYRGTIEIPMSADIEDFAEHISFEFSAPFSDEWSVDIYQEDIEIEHEEE